MAHRQSVRHLPGRLLPNNPSVTLQLTHSAPVSATFRRKMPSNICSACSARCFDGMEKTSKWAVPLAVFGLGSLGVLAMSDLGLEALDWLQRRFEEAPGR